MGLTKAQRHNKRMEEIFKQAREDLPSSLNKFYWRKGKVVKRRK
jgi:hypothetical protein|tara:strand:- start:3 stop:134 length:132 start_codon:yes stop_codon:yes gene_type:complete